jgi:hypothetical protein
MSDDKNNSASPNAETRILTSVKEAHEQYLRAKLASEQATQAYDKASQALQTATKIEERDGFKFLKARQRSHVPEEI